MRQSVNVNGNRAVVNGKSYDIPAGGSVSVINGQVFVNGRLLSGDERLSGVVEVVIHGTVQDLHTDAPVTVQGDVRGNVQAGGSVQCDSVGGSVAAGGSVNCGVVAGGVSAGGSVVRR